MKRSSIVLGFRHKCWAVGVVTFIAGAILLTKLTFAQSVRQEFFESKIRPVLVEQCYECHNSVDDAEAGLAVDWRDGIRSESSHGIVVVPFKPKDSLLLKVIRHEVEGLKMPEGSTMLSAQVIADFEKWIADGAVDPRLKPPSKDEFKAATSWDAKLAERKLWWCFQPIKSSPVPPSTNWSDHPIDRFVAQKHSQSGLSHAEQADKAVLIRRLSFALTGLPPSLEQIDEFAKNHNSLAYEELVDDFLNSQRFGERWARHWMDLVRYADSHGSEGDPAIPHAFQYRDYLIRALNADVPYDQLVLEHIAGDLLREPRINSELGINESAIGTSHLRMVFHGFAPTDALDEKVRFTDDQINVVSKAFQALTISCARCHDHKFDAISQADYYALFGVFGSCRPAMHDVNLPRKQSHHQEALLAIKKGLRTLLADHWLEQMGEIPNRLEGMKQKVSTDENNDQTTESLLTPWQAIHQALNQGEPFDRAWGQQRQLWEQATQEVADDKERKNDWHWDLAQTNDYHAWFPLGNGLTGNPTAAGEFTVATSGDEIITSIYPAGVYTHHVSTLHHGVLGSPRISLDDEYQVWLRVIGGGQASIRYVVQDYPRDGTVYPINSINQRTWNWHHFDLSYWSGDHVHFELATSKDAPLKVGGQDRSWFGVREIIVRRTGQPRPPSYRLESWAPLFAVLKENPPESPHDIAAAYKQAIKTAVNRWRSGVVEDDTALFLDACLHQGLISNSLAELPEAFGLIQRYRELEAKIPLPTRVPGVSEADAYDQPLLHRGDHKRPLEPVPRRFLQVIDARPFVTKQSGRLELANALLDEENPLTARVIVNRIWHYLFGQGIVATPDNFGKLGVEPTHPELLDFLADRMRRRGWSIKDTIRFVVLSETWKQASTRSQLVKEIDPGNKFLSHANVRRLDAESIRDSLLAVSGEMDDQMYGPGFAADSDDRRRSVYVLSRRNSMDAFLQVFDSPVPFATTGRRSQTNVPAQSLTLMNDPIIVNLARSLGRRVRQEPRFKSDDQRRAHLFRRCTGRSPTDQEMQWLRQYAMQTMQKLAERRRIRAQLESELTSVSKQIDAIVNLARTKLLAEMGKTGPVNSGLNPVSRWNFADGLKDTIGNAHGKLRGDAQLTKNGLVLSGQGFVETDPIDMAIQEKTLEAWVRLAQADQRGGGVITLQDLEGGVFDSIVYGEQSPRNWLAGSNNFQRTENFDGQDETDFGNATVHIAIAYDRDGTIRGYRNGKLYGHPYRKSDVMTFAEKQSQIVLGLRHGKAVSPGRMLQGTVLEARLYDRALTSEQIMASASGQAFVSRKDILNGMLKSDRELLERLEQAQSDLQNQLQAMGNDIDQSESWTWLVHSLFNLKEFIYIR